jgi:hypothetical protein
MKYLLAHSADPNPRGYRASPLQIAAFQGDGEVVRYLLKAGALCNAVGEENGLEGIKIVIWAIPSMSFTDIAPCT